jgi:PPOX class probable F420-dependent enzyme
MTDSASFFAMGDEKFVSLTTFRKSGEGISTTVWIAHDGDDLIVTTEKGTGKVKRIRNNPRVELRPSSRFGTVKDDAPVVSGTATVFDDDESRQTQTGIFRAKYGVQYRIFMLIEQRGSARGKNRVMLRIAPAASA